MANTMYVGGAVVLAIVVLLVLGYFGGRMYCKSQKGKDACSSGKGICAMKIFSSACKDDTDGGDSFFKRLMSQNKKPAAARAASAPAPAPIMPQPQIGVVSNKAGGYSMDSAVPQMNTTANMAGSYVPGTDPKAGTSRVSFASVPMASENKLLAASTLNRGGSRLAKSTKVDLQRYANADSERIIGAQGLDMPEDLAIASAQLGHMEVAGSTRTQSQHPWGETPYSWQVGYSVNERGEVQPGIGADIPQYGPAQLALRPRGVNF